MTPASLPTCDRVPTGRQWGGSLIRLLPIWKMAERVNWTPGLWSPPTSYTRETPLRTGPFEQYLRNEWRDEIFGQWTRAEERVD